MKKVPRVSETPATQWLRTRGVAFTRTSLRLRRAWWHGESARQLGVPEHEVVKTLVMQDDKARPLVVLMHGDCQVSTKNLARQIGAKVGRALPARGGAAPQRLPDRRHLPVRPAQADAGLRGGQHPGLPRILINGGRRGFLVGIPPAVLDDPLGARPVQCALAG
jgi:prolyl-tRNA editing enzyme YbaK/EbsC (Cys-tRNA(Pro) deacylase)